MRTKLEQVLCHCLKGRQIAVWGNPTRRLLRALQAYPFCQTDSVNRHTHYVVAVTEDDLEDFLSDPQSIPFRDVEDYIAFSDEGKELPFEWTCFGVPVGRQTYFGEGFADACRNSYIERIGRYTSINGTAQMAANHPMNAMFVSDELPRFFSEENRALYEARYLSLIHI